MADTPEYAKANINHISSDVFRANYDVQTSLMQHTVKKLAGDLYKPDTMGGTLFYAGVIFSVSEELSPDNSDVSFFAKLFGGSGQKKIRQYRVFIPELFRGLVAPTIFAKDTNIDSLSPEDQKRYAESSQTIKSLPIIDDFRVGEQQDPVNLGDMVWVMFQNSNTRERGFLFSKIIGDTGISAGSTTANVNVSHPLNKSTLSRPTDLTPQQASTDNEKLKEPPGFNGKWIVDYSAIIDIMGSSKGWPYRYWWFPYVYSPEQRGEDARNEVKKYLKYKKIDADDIWNKYGISAKSKADYDILLRDRPAVGAISGKYSDWEYGSLGLDCTCFVKRALVRLGMVNPGQMVNNKTLGSLMDAGTFQDFLDTVKDGDQVPGDLCAHGETYGNWTHFTLVVSYPDTQKNNQSTVWGANGGNPLCDGITNEECAKGGVGYNAYATKNPLETLKAFSPLYGNYREAHQYYRLKKIYVNPGHLNNMQQWIKDAHGGNFNKILKNGDLPNNLDMWPFTKEGTNLKMFIKYHPRQYSYPSKVSEHPSSVINAPDQSYDQRVRVFQKTNS